MNKLLIAATLSILGASAFAQAPSTPSASPVPSSASATSAVPSSTPADKHQQRAAGKFRKLDANNDGMLSRDEVAARPGLAKNFDTIDSNKDGKLSPDELRAYAQLRRSQHGAAPAKAS